MLSDTLFPDLSFLKTATSPTSYEEMLAQVSLLAVAIQGQLADAPRFAAEPQAESTEPALLTVEQFDERWGEWRDANDQWWQEQAHFSSGRLRNQLRDLFELEVAILAITEPSIRERMEALWSVQADIDLGQVIAEAGEIKVRLPGCFVYTADFDVASHGGEDFLVYGLGWGAWFSAEPVTLAARVQQALLAGEPWTLTIPAALRTAVREGAALELSFEEVDYSVSRRMLEDLQDLQIQLLGEVSRHPSNDQLSLSRLNAAIRLDSWVSQVQDRVASYLKAYRLSTQVQWVTELEGDELAHYAALEQAKIDAQTTFDDHLGSLADYRTFAAARIRAWLEANADGLRIAPEKTQLTIHRLFSNARGQRKSTVLDWVISGGYDGYDLFVEPSAPDLEEVLTHAVLQRMINQLNLRESYYREVSAAYQDAQTQALLGELIRAEMLFAALAALHAEVLPAPTHANLIALLEDDQPTAELQVHRLQLREHYLDGVVAFATDESFILYAPGSPGGHFQRFANERELVEAVFEMLNNPVGIAYLLERIPVQHRQPVQEFVHRVEPITWRPTIIGLQPHDGGLRQVLLEGRLSVHRSNRLQATPQWYLEASQEDRQHLDFLDNQLAALEADYIASNGMQTLLDFAHDQASDRINGYPGNSGFWIDPDTVRVESSEGALSFTQWMAWGYPTGFNFAGFSTLSSTRGQDLSHLNLSLLASAIRGFSSQVREQYSTRLENRYLADDRPQRERQHRLHGLVMNVKLRRDFLAASLQGYLNDTDASWLKELAQTPVEIDILDNVRLGRLAFHRGEYRLVDGCYLLEKTAGERFVYLSDPANGQTVRTFMDIASSWYRENLGPYFTSRVIHSDKAAMRALDSDRWENGEQVVLDTLPQLVDWIDSWEKDHQRRVEHLLADARSQTTSVGDRVFETLDLIGSKVASALTLGFPPIAAVINLIQAVRDFSKSYTSWWDGEKLTSAFYFILGITGVASATGVTSLVSAGLAAAWSKLRPGPSGPAAELLKAWFKELASPYGLKTASAASSLFTDEFIDFIKPIFAENEPPSVLSSK